LSEVEIDPDYYHNRSYPVSYGMKPVKPFDPKNIDEEQHGVDAHGIANDLFYPLILKDI